MQTPCWPAAIECAGQADLTFIRDQSQWDRESHLHGFIYRPEDRLIDSSGLVFKLTDKELHASGKSVDLDEFLALIRAHAAQNGECCVAKFSANSMAEAMQTLGAMATN